MWKLRLAAVALLLAGCPDRWETGVRRAPLDTFYLDRPGDTDTDPDTEPDTEPDTDPPLELEACYLGQDRAGTTCLPVEDPPGTPSGYSYPAPLGGSAQYRAPFRFLDLEAEDPDQRLAPNFTLSEFAQAYKGRWAVVQPHAVARIQGLRDQLGALIVNSGYRSPSYNASIGGASSSRHMYGDAFDIDPVSVSLEALRAACVSAGAGYVGVYTTHIHCDWRDDPLDAAFFGSARAAAPAPPPALDAWIDHLGGRLVAPAEGWDEGEPLREWTAWDASGAVIEVVRAETYAPPARAARVRVEVGMALTREIDLR